MKRPIDTVNEGVALVLHTPFVIGVIKLVWHLVGLVLQRKVVVTDSE